MKLLRFITLALILVIATTILVACDEDSDKNTDIIVDFVGPNGAITSIKYNANTFVLPNPEEISGQVFDNWYFDKACTALFDTSLLGEFAKDGHVTVYAKYSKYEYIDDTLDVYFYIDDFMYHKLSVALGKRFEMPTEPTKLGYDFIGWYTDKTLKNPYDINDLIKNGVQDDINLYAKFVEKSATVTLYVDTKVIDTITARKSNPQTSFNAPAINGQTFLYWVYVDTKEKFDFAEYFSSNILEDVSLLAVYVNDSVQVTLKSQDHIINTIELPRENILELPTLDDTAFATFEGWLLNGVTFDIDSFNSSELRQDITLDASWLDKVSKITYTIDETTSHVTTISGESILDPVTTPTKVGKFFEYWYFMSDGVEVIFDINEYYQDINRADITVYPKYSDATQKVNFVVDNKVVETVYLNSDNLLTMPANPTKLGEKFVEWQLDGSKFNVKEFNTNLAQNKLTKYEYNIVAKFNQITTKIIFHVGGAEEHISVVYRGEESINMPTPTIPAGQKFVGWYYSNDPTKQFDLAEYRADPNRQSIFLEPKFEPVKA